MTIHEHHMVEVFFALLIMLLIAVVYYTDRRFSRERERNAKLIVRIENLQSVVRTQDHLLVTKIDVILDEHHNAKAHATVVDEPAALINVDQVLLSMEYCYECYGLRSPTHFRTTGHRVVPAPELTGP